MLYWWRRQIAAQNSAYCLYGQNSFVNIHAEYRALLSSGTEAIL